MVVERLGHRSATLYATEQSVVSFALTALINQAAFRYRSAHRSTFLVKGARSGGKSGVSEKLSGRSYVLTSTYVNEASARNQKISSRTRKFLASAAGIRLDRC
ncbi:hypothetical protein [Micromonospora sp. RP3T]|uniref:hypothetical protein n=1 Tax=Micromonospora sp. RP3T TaxID=2135446 RepID=UPI003D711100